METTKDTGSRPQRPVRKKKPAPARKRPVEGARKRPAAAAPAKKRRTAPAAPARRGRSTSVDARRRKRPSAAALQKRTAPLRPRRYDPDRPRVVYTPPKPFSRSRLLIRLATVVAVVLAVTFGLSIFFKVENITVSGAVKYDPWTVKEASGIELGDNLLTFGESKASAKIKIALPYVDTVNIEIKEFNVVYAIRDASEQWWLITAEGNVVEKTDSASAGDRTKVLGVKLGAPAPGQQAVAQADSLPEPTGDAGEAQAPVTVTAADRLSAALQILQHLEGCGILGDVASVDVSDLGSIELWYGTRFQVKLGDTSRLEYKIRSMNAAINGTDPNNTLKDYDSGMLDVSFTIKENQLIYQGFTD